jgi:hypothetical protein
MNRKLPLSLLGVLALTLFAGLALARPATAATQPTVRVAMQPQTTLSLLQQATQLGQHAHDSRIKLTVSLKLRHVAKLKRFLQAVQNPRSPEYHHFLTPRQFTAQYGPSKAQVAAVVQFLKQHGITVKNVSRNRLLIHTQASTGTYDHALGIKIYDYKLKGRRFFSTTDSPKLPASISGFVQNILGLDNAVLMRPHYHVKKRLGSIANSANPQAAPPPATSSYFNPAQTAKAYDWPDITNTRNGSGVSIAVATANAPGLTSDDSPHAFWNAYGLPDHTINVIPVDGQPTLDNGTVETLLDVEYSGAMGPGATLNVYMGADAQNTTFTDVYNEIVNDNTSQVMTTSWGLYESSAPSQYQTDEAIFMQGAAQGISMFAAAGDNGSGDNAPTGDNNADYPSSSKYITSANGTELTIADVSGSYGNEHAWSGTGGAISQLFIQPSWQTGPGVPDNGMRMNSDMALNAGSLHPYVVYQSGVGFGSVYGTSAVAPIFAGLFAIGVSQQTGGASLGQSNALIYNDVNANSSNYASDFRDVTTGSNGAFDAGPDWDHPTGWGSPKATSLLSHLGVHGPSGTLKGTVSDAASGEPVADASVVINPGNYHLKTADDGTYSTQLGVGDYTATASAFAYQDDTASVTITDGNTTTQDFSLAAAPTATISGRIKDGSGHGYGLYAEISVSARGFGQVADVWTDPKTGQYSVSLPKGYDYTMTVTSFEDGYTPGSATVTSLSGNVTKNFPLTVTTACTAPGYAIPFSADFNGNFPPTGWSVSNAISDSPVVWQLNTGYKIGNYTGGTDTAATADSNDVLPRGGAYDTSLVTPPIPVTRLQGETTLMYKASYIEYSDEALDLGISTDGGKHWTTITHWASDHGTLYALPGESETVDLAQYLPASGDFQLRWRYYELNNGFDYYAQIDDVAIGGCVPLPGGLVEGQVTDQASGKALIGARVSSDTDKGTKTFVNPADANLPAGFYLLFVGAGKHALTASYGQYSPATASVSVAKNGIKTQNFALKAPKFTANPGSVKLHVTVGEEKTQTFTVKNTGNGAGQFKIIAIDAPPPPAGAAAAQAVPLHTVKGHFTPAMMSASHAGEGNVLSLPRLPASVVPHDAPWTDITAYPSAIQDNVAATEPATGLVYSVYGFDGKAMVNSGTVYDPDSSAWSPIANAPNARENAVGKFIGGKLYVANGFSASGDPTPTLAIYDPANDTWTTGTDNPNAAAGGSAGAVLNGDLYVVGGCEGGQCNNPVATVAIYDPATNNWSVAAPYPHGVTFASCGAINGKLYCAGGNGYSDGYVYDPSTDKWSAIADMPESLWGAGYIASQGKLLLSGGVNGSQLTNAGFAYDPSSDSWSSLPNANESLYRGGSSCGFYRIGGSNGSAAVSANEILPGYPCGVGSPPYLTVAPVMATLAVGASAEVTLSFDGAGQQAFTTSKSYLKVTESPYSDIVVPVTVTWDPGPVNLVLAGNVSPTGTVSDGDVLTYTIGVKNKPGDNIGPATHTTLTYKVPDGVIYFSATGDASCTPAPGSSSTPAAATAAPPSGIVVCGFGTLDPGKRKLETIAVQATQGADTVKSTFEVSSDEKDTDTDNNSITLSTNPNTGPTGPTGPQGPKGDSGSGGFGWIALVALLGLMVPALSRRRYRA